jgi:hypothetical protein
VLFVRVSRENRQAVASGQLLTDYRQKKMIILSPATPQGWRRIPSYTRNFHASHTKPAQNLSTGASVESEAQQLYTL